MKRENWNFVLENTVIAVSGFLFAGWLEFLLKLNLLEMWMICYFIYLGIQGNYNWLPQMKIRISDIIVDILIGIFVPLAAAYFLLVFLKELLPEDAQYNVSLIRRMHGWLIASYALLAASMICGLLEKNIWFVFLFALGVGWFNFAVEEISSRRRSAVKSRYPFIWGVLEGVLLPFQNMLNFFSSRKSAQL